MRTPLPPPGRSLRRLAAIGATLGACLLAAHDGCRLTTDPFTGELHVVIGTLELVDTEGGCWRLRGDDGRRYELRRDLAPAALLRDGARVRVVVRPRPDLASVCQAGEVVEVERVEAVR